MKKFSILGLFRSKGRIFKESNNRYRTPFQRDKDRIVHSASFRRLKHKTQVFLDQKGSSIQVSMIINCTTLQSLGSWKPSLPQAAATGAILKHGCHQCR